MTTADYLTQLQQDREDLVDNLEAKGITGLSGDETFTELVPEVLNIPSGGSTISPSYITFKGIPAQQQQNLDISNIDTSNIEDMSQMFLNCTSVASLDVSNFNTSNVTTMKDMFCGCAILHNLDLSNFNTSNVTDVSSMFLMCSELEFLDVRTFEFSNITTTTDVFGNAWWGKVPANCEIIVKDATEKTWVNTNYDWLTNVKTVAEYEGS